MKPRIISLCLPFLAGSIPVISVAATVTDPSSAWTTMAGNYDYLVDQQTGQPASDIVGEGTNHGFFITFNDDGATSSTDGTLGFRIRLDEAGGNKNSPAFTNVAWLGIDANIDGAIDAFLGLNLSGSTSQIQISDAGTGTNTSPNTTTISNSPYKTYATSASNYNYRPVNYVSDGGTTNDVTTNTTGDPDYYVSFMVPFADVVAFLGTKSITINDQSPLRYVLATSTQPNSLNQDLGGVNGQINSSTNWVDLGGFSQIVTANGTVVVPEPSSGFLALGTLTIALLRRRR